MSAEKATGGSREAAARSSRRGQKTLKFEGLSLKIPAKLPFEVLRYVTIGEDGTTVNDVVGVLRAVLGDEQMETVWNHGLDLDQGVELAQKLFEVSGISAGE